MKTNYDNHVGPGCIATIITLSCQPSPHSATSTIYHHLTPTPVPPNVVNTSRHLSYYPNASCQHTNLVPLLSPQHLPFTYCEFPLHLTGLTLSRQIAMSPAPDVCVTLLTHGLHHPLHVRTAPRRSRLNAQVSLPLEQQDKGSGVEYGGIAQWQSGSGSIPGSSDIFSLTLHLLHCGFTHIISFMLSSAFG